MIALFRRIDRRIGRWLCDHGFFYYCHPCDWIYVWWQKCAHKPRWWRG